MTVHLISVGKSIVDAFDKPRERLKGNRDLAADISDAEPAKLLTREGVLDHQRDLASDWLTAALAAPGSPVRDQARADRLAEVARRIHPDLWPDDFSAEIGTFVRMPGTRRPFPEEDIAVLVCSDTPTGLFAGVWNALALTYGSLDRVLYIADPADSAKQLSGARGHVVIARVPGMDAGDDRGFHQAMGALGVLARELFTFGQLKQAEPFQFCLSGGYKATIPYLIGLAEAVRSVDETRLDELGAAALMPGDGSPYPVEAYVLHEEAPRPIRLPLRRLLPEAVRDELAGFGDDEIRRKKGKPDPGTLEGYAYEAEGPQRKETCKLTAFGVGLRELLGVPDEVPG
jgi:hypothetical protein